MAAHRLFYTVGVANGLGPSDAGSFDGNGTKDVYARIDYKFGGMGLDGDTTGVRCRARTGARALCASACSATTVTARARTSPWTARTAPRCSSRTAPSTAKGSTSPGTTGDLNLFGVALHGQGPLRTYDAETGDRLGDISPTYDSWFLQGDYVIRPPFQVSLRYEELRPGDRAVDKIKFLNANFTYLVRANIKAMIEYQRDLQDTQNYQLAGVLRFAY